MALAFLGISPRAMIWFLNSWDYLFYLIILFTYETLEWVKPKTLFLSLITLFGLPRMALSLEKPAAQNVAVREKQG